MKYITREQLDKIVQGKKEIKAEDLVYILEENFGYSVSLENKPQLTDEQKKRMTDYIFTNQDILKQLRQSSTDQDYIENDEEAINIISEARGGR